MAHLMGFLQTVYAIWNMGAIISFWSLMDHKCENALEVYGHIKNSGIFVYGPYDHIKIGFGISLIFWLTPPTQLILIVCMVCPL